MIFLQNSLKESFLKSECEKQNNEDTKSQKCITSNGLLTGQGGGGLFGGSGRGLGTVEG